MKHFYTIGDVSQKVGLSRDTLRFYEKKGILKPQKMENGYRSYTEEDILHLMKIMFYRNIHFSIDEIQSILWNSSYQGIMKQVQAKIDEETVQIEEHRRSLINLRTTLSIFKKIETYLNRCRIGSFPEFYLFDDHNTPLQLGVLPSCYILQEIQITGNEGYLQHEYMAIPVSEIRQLGREGQFQDIPVLSKHRCVYTILLRNSRNIHREEIQNMIEWAERKGEKLKGSLYLTTLLSYIENGISWYYLELFFPVE